jgi:hypothetical protein
VRNGVKTKFASFDGLVAGETGFVHRLVGGFAIGKISESPAVRRGVFCESLTMN